MRNRKLLLGNVEKNWANWKTLEVLLLCVFHKCILYCWFPLDSDYRQSTIMCSSSSHHIFISNNFTHKKSHVKKWTKERNGKNNCDYLFLYLYFVWLYVLVRCRSVYFLCLVGALLVPRMIRMWVSRAKCSLNIALDVLNCSSKLGRLVSLFGEIGGVAYSGDMQPTSERSAKSRSRSLKQLSSRMLSRLNLPKLSLWSSAFMKMSEWLLTDER